MFYDVERDTLHIDFRVSEAVEGPAITTYLDARRILHHDQDGGLLAIELLEASRGVVLDGLPARTLIGRTLQRLRLEHGWRYHAVCVEAFPALSPPPPMKR